MKKLFWALMIVWFCTVLFASCAKPEFLSEPTGASELALDSDIVGTPSELTAQMPQPVYAHMLADGRYEISVKSSSSMFRPIKAVLIVEENIMNVCMTMSGQGYGYLYMGTGEEALADNEDAYIPFILDANGAKTFTVPVVALNIEIDCAAWSIEKEKWYDRVLVFQSDLIPADTITEG